MPGHEAEDRSITFPPTPLACSPPSRRLYPDLLAVTAAPPSPVLGRHRGQPPVAVTARLALHTLPCSAHHTLRHTTVSVPAAFRSHSLFNRRPLPAPSPELWCGPHLTRCLSNRGLPSGPTPLPLFPGLARSDGRNRTPGQYAGMRQ
jgi:hypothetical protein